MKSADEDDLESADGDDLESADEDDLDSADEDGLESADEDGLQSADEDDLQSADAQNASWTGQAEGNSLSWIASTSNPADRPARRIGLITARTALCVPRCPPWLKNRGEAEHHPAAAMH